MQIGSWKVMTALEGCFLLDGGSMFGIVPRTLWSRFHPPDDQNRIVMALRGLVLVGHGRKILVDCGIGNRFDDSQQKIYRHQRREGGMPGALALLGIQPGELTDVVATHLHFDHVGGMLTPDEDGRLVPTFPGATVHVQEDCWEWARNPSIWDQGSFFQGDFSIWEKSLDMRLLHGDAEIAPGVQVRVTCGHTPGQQIVVVGEGEGSLVYCADLIPTAAHIRLPYIMAYDHRPHETLDEKKVLLARALEENWVLVFEHDPGIPACRLQEKNGKVLPGENVCVNLAR
jgi:glyoxylase-like metal-dependent hydrolase (beta-lactamase superfamily II)